MTDVSASHPAALLSLPALGALFLRRRALWAVVLLVDELVGDGSRLRRSRVRDLVAPVKRIEPDEDHLASRTVGRACAATCAS